MLERYPAGAAPAKHATRRVGHPPTRNAISARHPGGSALLIHNDAAVAMLPFVLRDLGLDVPADRSVVSLHSAELARLYVLSYTAVESEPVAQAAIELLCKRIEDPGAPVERRLVTPRLERRSSVADRA
jgi:DNA-binding LacI/PurR family transcriptional regulator